MRKRISIMSLLVLSAVLLVSGNRAATQDEKRDEKQDEKTAVNQGAAVTKTTAPSAPTPSYPLAPLTRDFKDSLPIEVGEKLEYEVKYSRYKVINGTLGVVTFEYPGPVTISQSTINQPGESKIEPLVNGLNMEFTPSVDEQLLRLRAVAVPKGFFISLFGKGDSRYRYESLVDANNFAARLNVLEVKEDEKHSVQSNIFDIENQQVKYLTTNLANKQALPRGQVLPYQEGMMSLLSAIYFVRFQKYEEGQLIQFPVSSEEMNYVFEILVGKREAVQTECGKRMAIKLEPKLFGPGKYFSRATGQMFIWMSDDKQHTPLKLLAKTNKGTINAKLINVNKKNCRVTDPDVLDDSKPEVKTKN
jgi:Protein of unknown function (DUF3108)